MKSIRFLRPLILGGCLLILGMLVNAAAFATTTIQPQQCDLGTNQCNNGTSIISNLPVIPGAGVSVTASAGCNGPYCGVEAYTVTASTPIDAFGACVYVDNPRSNGASSQIFVPFGNNNDWQGFLRAADTGGAASVADLKPCIRPPSTPAQIQPDSKTCSKGHIVVGSPYANATPYYSPSYTRPGTYSAATKKGTASLPVTAEYDCGGFYEFVTYTLNGWAQLNSPGVNGNSGYSTSDGWALDLTSGQCFIGTNTSNPAQSIPTTTACAPAPTINLTATDISVSPNLVVSTGTAEAASITISTGEQLRLSWVVGNVTALTACTASGNWSGAQPTSTPNPAPLVTPPSSGATYSLTCSNGSGQSTTASIQVTVKAPVVVVSPDVTLTATNLSGPSDVSVSTTNGVTTLTVTAGNAISLSWNVAGLTASTQCLASGSWSGAQSPAAPNPAPTFVPPSTGATYTLGCNNGPGLSNAASVKVVVNPAVTAPTITLVATDTASPSTSVSATNSTATLAVNSGDSVALSWSLTGVTASTKCTASGGWSGAQDVSTPTPIPTFTPPSTGTTYTLTCDNGPGLSSTASINVNVTAAPAGVCQLVNPVTLSPPYSTLSGSNGDYILNGGGLVTISGSNTVVSALGDHFNFTMSGENNCVVAPGGNNLFVISGGGANLTLNVGGTGNMIMISGTGGVIAINGDPAGYMLLGGAGNTLIINGVTQGGT